MPSAPRTFYLIAIGGTAMTPLAGLLTERGDRVLGSDGPLYPPMSDRLAALGIEVRPAWRSENLTPDVTHVVVGNLARADNPELLEALRRGLPTASMPQTLHDEILEGRHPVVVAGTHGKTTTTALVAWVLARSGHDPGFLVGGEPLNFDAPARLGSGPAFVVEGDEYSTSYADKGPKFLHYAPRTFVLTSVEFDHADLYADLTAVKEAFRKGVAIVPGDGRVVAFADDPNIRDVLGAARAPVTLYSLDDPGAELFARNVTESADGLSFDVHRRGAPLLLAALPMSGRHNVANALAAVAVGLGFGLPPEEIAAGLATFRGVKRRMEVKGTAAGVTVVDDFAHHPTAVASTILGAKKRFFPRRVWAVFEPRSMTAGRADFFGPYLDALSNADAVALAAPFHAARLAQPGGPGALDAAALVDRLRAKGLEALTGESPGALLAALLPKLRAGDVVVTMSSGAFGGLPAKLLEALERPGPRH
jgi:UDP-N-acetylmuramate: L-alanyl-gamma-D-glutamyl-meso-diaminopimelate ligase